MVNKTQLVTPDDDYDRLAERINNSYRLAIQDPESFKDAYKSYLSELDPGHALLKDKKHMQKTYDALRNRRTDLPEKNLFKEAGGKDLKKDREKTAKTVVKTRREYIRRGARNVDLEGYDTKMGPKGPGLTHVGKVKGKVVRVRRSFYVRNDKRIVVWRDRKGRFAKRS